MNHTPVKLGPLALLLTVISVCLTALAILSFSTAGADMRLAEKYAETVRTRYALEREGQLFLCEAAGGASLASLPDTETDGDGVTWRTLELDGARLRIGLAPDAENTYRIAAWRQDVEWNQDTSIGNLWAGF